MHDRAARTIPFFASQDIHFVAAIVPRLRIEFCAQNTIIYKEGDFAEHIYFIKMGQIGFLYRLARCYKTLNTGSYFGDLEFVKKVPRIFTVRSALNCEFLTLSRKEMDIIEANFPLVHE
jgi:CRP-like cAMP-binding protein